MSFRCAFCDSQDLELICDFGHMGLAGAFLTEEGISEEETFPMRLCFCNECSAVQIVDQIAPDQMFKKGYFYFSSAVGTLRTHFEAYAREIVSDLLEDPQASVVLEFGCNDGVLLNPLSDLSVGTLIGVDPASNVISKVCNQRIHTINSYFDEPCAEGVLSAFGQVDLILANNVFAHIADINGVTRAVEKCLAPDGVFAFEVHYLGKVVDELQYDMIYHEHIYYYSLIAIENHFDKYDMGVCDVRQLPNHGGSIRVYVSRKSSHRFGARSDAVEKLREREILSGFNSNVFFRGFGARISRHKDQLVSLLQSLKSDGKVIVGYGASGRANTVLQYCGIDSTVLDYIVDDAPAKTGFFTPGSHLKILPSIKNQTGDYPDYVVVFAWTFINEIAARNMEYLENGGKFIVPLPKVQILDKSNITSIAGVVL